MEKNSFADKLEQLFKKVVNRETIIYIIAGALTTAVNFISYISLFHMGVPNLTANALAWVIAVVFAYIVNKIGVFLSDSKNVKEEALKVVKFFGARLVTLAIEQYGMYRFTVQMELNRLLVKACLAVIVIVLNYLLSKLYVFNQKNK